MIDGCQNVDNNFHNYLVHFEAFCLAKIEKFEPFLSVDRKSAQLESQFINELNRAEQVTKNLRFEFYGHLGNSRS